MHGIWSIKESWGRGEQVLPRKFDKMYWCHYYYSSDVFFVILMIYFSSMLYMCTVSFDISKKVILSIGSVFLLFFWSTFAQVCSVELDAQEEFEPSQVWVWFNDANGDKAYDPSDWDRIVNRIDARETTLVGDVDGDGVPEVIVDDYKNPGDIYVFDGETWAVEHTIATNLDFTQNSSANGIADTDGNWFGEIYLVDDLRAFHRFDFDGTSWSQTWTSPDLVHNDRYVPHFADFDGDGTPEVHMGTQIFRVSDGAKIIDWWFNSPDLWWSVAADMLPVSGICADCWWLELIYWSKVFSVDISAGTMTERVTDWLSWHRSSIYPTSVADMDNDGDLDVVYTTRSLDSDPRIVVRDGQTSDVLLTRELNTRYSVWWSWRANIADFDGDGCNEIWVVTYRQYIVLDDVYADDGWCPWVDSTGPLSNTWWEILRFINNTDSSAVTSSSVFDFDYDGVYEVVYRDQTHLYILDGKEWLGTTYDAIGNIITFSSTTSWSISPKYKQTCSSWTRYENPVIADVNDDWATEIIVVCGNTAWTVYTFASWSDPWAPSRPVWNQHGYNITNVNDDLTIPSSIKYNPTRAWWVHDNFLTQSLPIDTDFVPTNSFLPPGHVFAADAVLDILTVDASSCAASMSIDLEISNSGDASLPASTPLQIYAGDPTAWPASSIWSWVLWASLGTGQIANVTISVSACVSPLYAVINDGTTSTPYGLTWSTLFPSTSIAECSYENNIDSISFRYCSDWVLDLDLWEECDDGNAIANDGCSIHCEIEYCRDDAPLHDTSKNFVITDLSPTLISWTSSQPNSQVAICFEDTTSTRDVFYTTTDAQWSFAYSPNLSTYASPWVNVWVMLHDADGLDIDHHAMMLLK